MREQALMHLVRPSGLLKCFAAAALFAGSLVPVANSHAKLAESAEMAETSHTAEEQRNLDAVRTAFAHWEKGTGDFMDILADDARWTIKGSGPDARTFNSRREFQTAMRPFGQIDTAFNKRHEGTGLGLPIAYALARLHGGDLRIDSQKGVGTRVSLILPTADSPAATQELPVH